jgi:hypothetical protein
MKSTYAAWLLLYGLAFQTMAAEPEWNRAAIKECDRACLVGIMDGYMNAIFKHDPKAVPPLALDVRMTENTGQIDVGEGVLWRSKTEPTSFKIYVADPVQGQVAEQARLKVQGRDTLVVVRLKVDRSQIQEIEQLHAGNINEAAIPLLTTPRPTLVNDVPAAQRTSREVTFPLFIHDGTRRGAAPDAPPGMLQNLVTMETFGIRGGLIHEVEVFPFVTLPYGLGNGWTPGSGR